MKSQTNSGRATRRQVLFGTVALAASSAAPFRLQAAVAGSVDEKFMTASQLLVNHRLEPAVGARIASFAASEHPDLDSLLDTIIDTARAAGTKTVEEFFDRLPEGAPRDFASWVIAAWYRGSSSAARDATLFTYEEALLYQPTLDMVPIPTFGFSAPNAWGNDLYPLTDLPRF